MRRLPQASGEHVKTIKLKLFCDQTNGADKNGNKVIAWP